MSAGTPKLYTITVGPITSHGNGPQQIKNSERRIRDEMDDLIRKYWQVGKRNKAVKIEVTEA